MALTDDHREMTSAEMHLEIKRLRGLLEECKPFVKRIAVSDKIVFWDCDENAEHLWHTTINDAVACYLDGITGPLELPDTVTVYGWRRVAITATDCGSMLLDALERLDEEYGNPDGDVSAPTKKMIDAEAALIKAICDEYVTWACEPVDGAEVTIETVAWIKEHRPDWIGE